LWGIGWQALEATTYHPSHKRAYRLANSYHAALYAYGSGQQWEKLQATYDTMKEAGVMPKTFTFNTLITAYAKGGPAQGERLDAIAKVRFSFLFLPTACDAHNYTPR